MSNEDLTDENDETHSFTGEEALAVIMLLSIIAIMITVVFFFYI